MKAALLDSENKITNIILVNDLADVSNCYFISNTSTLNIGDTYVKELAEMNYLPNSEHPHIKLESVFVGGAHVTLGAGGIWWLPINEQFTLTANAQLEDMEMMIIIERVVNGGDVIDDLRAKASIVDGLITITSKFVQSGNYQITSERLNAGLEAVNAPFRLAFNKVEFDAYV